MATIKVNSTVMRDKAATFNGVSKTVRTYTDDMLKEIEGLRAYWEGDAAESTVKQFNSLVPKFEEICASIDKYSSFLEEAARKYDEAETENTGA